MRQDHVDRILEQWKRERPDVETSPMGVIGRLHRVGALANRSISSNFRQQGITSESFDVLATLRRSGPPYRLNPSQLLQWLMLTSGSLTNRLDRLEAEGYIERLPDPDDRRATLVALTDRGREVVDRVFPSHMETERSLLSMLSVEEQHALAELLRKMLLGLESEGQ